MKKKKQLTPEQQLQESLTQLKNYRPLDDDFMRELFRNNWALAELVLRIITGIKDLTLIQQETQYDLKRLVGAKSICLDVFGKDSISVHTLATKKTFKVTSSECEITLPPENALHLRTKKIDGITYFLIPAGTDIVVNGMEAVTAGEE